MSHAAYTRQRAHEIINKPLAPSLATRSSPRVSLRMSSPPPPYTHHSGNVRLSFTHSTLNHPLSTRNSVSPFTTVILLPNTHIHTHVNARARLCSNATFTLHRHHLHHVTEHRTNAHTCMRRRARSVFFDSHRVSS
jgi:hypothetical protein